MIILAYPIVTFLLAYVFIMTLGLGMCLPIMPNIEVVLRYHIKPDVEHIKIVQVQIHGGINFYFFIFFGIKEELY